MAGDQKEAAQKRTAEFLKKDPNHFKKLAQKRKGKPNPSSTKFTSKVAAKLGAKGGKAGAGKKKTRRTPEQIQRDHEKAQKRIDRNNAKANEQFQNEFHRKIVKEGFKS